MTRVIVLTLFTILVLGQVATVHAANIDARLPAENQNSGIVIGFQGLATVHRTGPPEGHTVRAGERLHVADEIQLQEYGHVEVLWNRRAVFSLHGDSRMRLLDPVGRQTRVQLLGGAARFSYSYNEGHPADTLAILVSDVLLIMRGGIVEVESDTSGQVVRVVEGQVSIEIASSPSKQVLLKAGQGVGIRAGTVNTPHVSTASLQSSLPAMEEHRAIPRSVVQRLAQTHVQHALELEERIRHANEDDNEYADETGLILSTSLGVPPLAITPGTVATGPITSTISTSLGSPSIPAQPGTIPPPSAPNIITLSPVQVGGINTATVLQNTLKTVLGGR